LKEKPASFAPTYLFFLVDYAEGLPVGRFVG
jgi:hypothetical protein